jgi:hypothetical protein
MTNKILLGFISSSFDEIGVSIPEIGAYAVKIGHIPVPQTPFAGQSPANTHPPPGFYDIINESPGDARKCVRVRFIKEEDAMANKDRGKKDKKDKKVKKDKKEKISTAFPR